MENRDRFTLRPFVIADYEAVFALWLRSEGMGLGDGDSREGIAKFLDRNPGLSRVAEIDGRIIGAVMCGHDGRRGYLHHLAVDTAFQKRGIGRALVEACLAALKNEAIPRCSVFVYANNHAGRQFWDHFGWRLRDDIVIIQKVFSAEKPSC